MESTIGKRIQERRKALNITQTQIQKATGISSGNLSSIENGKILPSSSALICLSNILNCSTDYILIGDSPSLENENFSKNKEELLLLELFRQLDSVERNEIIELLEFKIQKRKSQKKSSELACAKDEFKLA